MGTFVTSLSDLLSEARFSARPAGARICAVGKAEDQAERKMWCSRSGQVMYFTVPRVWRWDFTVGVRATGEKTARLEEGSLTCFCVRWVWGGG